MNEQNTDPFTGTEIGPARYVWAPEVHEWFGERCIFILLPLSAVTRSSRRDVERLLEVTGIKSHSCYLAYGTYDLVLRFWATASEKTKVVKKLNEEFEFPGVEVFEVFDIDYSRWSRPEVLPDEEAIAKHFDLIRDSIADLSQEGADSLVKAGMLHRHPELSDEVTYVRVYVLLRRTTGEDGSPTDERLRALENAIGKLDELLAPSVYYGSSRSTDCILKGFVESSQLPRFHTHVISLRERLEKSLVNLRPMTLILAQDGEVDRDVLRLNPPEGHESIETRRLKALLRPDAISGFGALSQKFRDSLAVKFAESWGRLDESSFARPFLDLIEGLILEDEYRVNGSLAFLIGIEARVRHACLSLLFPRAAQAIDPGGPENWVVVIPNAIRHHGSASEVDMKTSDLLSSPKDLSLGVMARAVRLLSDLALLSEEEIAATLGPEWKRLEDVSDTRNDFAHARLLYSVDNQDAEPSQLWWADNCEKVVTAGLFLAGLESLEST